MMSVKRWNSFRVLASGAVSLLMVACGSDNVSVSSVVPAPDLLQEESVLIEGIGLQVDTPDLIRPVIYSPGVVNGNRFLSRPGSTVIFTGTGFTGVISVTFLGGLGNSDNAEAEFSIASDNQLLVTIPEDARTGLIRLSTGTTTASRFYIAPRGVPGYGSDPAPASTIDIGDVAVGTSESATLTITETGDATLLLTDANLTGDTANLDNFTIDIPTGFILDGGNPIEVTITCSPDITGTLTATLTVTTNDPENAEVEYPLVCNGIE